VSFVIRGGDYWFQEPNGWGQLSCATKYSAAEVKRRVKWVQSVTCIGCKCAEPCIVVEAM